ncbi:MAG TPA: hypothetical protein VFT74_19890, partial [Isosphaeraceae bacterium]|nr:hypothetical protein [Isosphaeraceae bacterium]
GTGGRMGKLPGEPSDEDKAKNVELVFKLVDRLPEPRRTKVKTLLEGQFGEYYFTAPASSREEFHSCYPGGLVVHSLNVIANLRKVAMALCPGRYGDPTLIFVGLFHDLGKAGDGRVERYLPNPSEWHRSKGMLYEVNKDCSYAPTAELGLYVLQKNGIEMDFEEWAAIRLNDGQYDENNRGYRMKEPDLALLLHFADLWSTVREKPLAGA